MQTQHNHHPKDYFGKLMRVALSKIRLTKTENGGSSPKGPIVAPVLRSRTASGEDMIIGIGVDFIENRRVKRELALGGWRSDDVFTAEEIKLCRRSRNAGLRYAACFAAKEAVLKALGARIQDLGMLREVEVHPCLNFEYEILLRGRAREELDRLGARRILVSIATGKEMTAAFVILEG